MVSTSREDVRVVLDGNEVPAKTELFQCCHIGLIFFSQIPIELYKQMDFNISVISKGSNNDSINCKGVIVDSEFEEIHGMYKTSFLYTDIDKSSKERLKSISEEKQLKCPFCTNY